MVFWLISFILYLLWLFCVFPHDKCPLYRTCRCSIIKMVLNCMLLQHPNTNWGHIFRRTEGWVLMVVQLCVGLCLFYLFSAYANIHNTLMFLLVFCMCVCWSNCRVCRGRGVWRRTMCNDSHSAFVIYFILLHSLRYTKYVPGIPHVCVCWAVLTLTLCDLTAYSFASLQMSYAVWSSH